jgi:hypothetical protein
MCVDRAADFVVWQKELVQLCVVRVLSRAGIRSVPAILSGFGEAEKEFIPFGRSRDDENRIGGCAGNESSIYGLLISEIDSSGARIFC